MKTIWKYPLPIIDSASIYMPVGSKNLCVQIQYGALYLWALVDTKKTSQKEERRFRVVGTGHNIDDINPRDVYVGTVQLSNGVLVLHVFEIIIPSAEREVPGTTTI